LAILETEVWVGIMKNAKYYEKLGYVIPKYKDKRQRMKIKRGTKILVKVEDLSSGSNVKLTKICDDCGEYCLGIKYGQIMISRNLTDGNDRCEKCGSIYAGNNQKENVEYERSLEYFAKTYGKGYLLSEFSCKNKKRLNNISFGTSDEYLWDCPDCKSEYPMAIYMRTKGINCPYCAGMRVNHTNCLWTILPDVASLLKNTQRGYEITVGSGKKEIFICNQCGFEQTKIVRNVVKDGFYCNRCSDKISYCEKFMANLFLQLNVDYEMQKVFNWSDKRRYDFFISSLNMIIETHGKQHYIDTGFEAKGGRPLKDEQENDLYKIHLAKLNKIDKYIILDCRESNIEFMKNTLLNSELCVFYSLNEIDWYECHAFASTSNMIKIICDLWNQGVKSTVEIAKIAKLERSTVGRYLKNGVKFGWCDYDPKVTTFQTQSNNGLKSGKAVVQLSINGEFIKVWRSCANAATTLSLSVGNISSVCRGERNSTGNYRWVYKEDYDEHNVPDLSHKRKRSVVQLSMDGEFIKVYESGAEASRCVDAVSARRISEVCGGRRNSSGGFKWMYKEDYDQELLNKNK
jgi:hypothetical protein